METSVLPIVEYGSFGVLVFIIIAAVRSFIPKIIEKFDNILTQQRKDYIAAMKEERERFSKVLNTEHELWKKTIVEALATIERNNKLVKDMTTSLDRLTIAFIYHDATVRGENPVKVGSTEELLEKLKFRSTNGDKSNGGKKKE